MKECAQSKNFVYLLELRTNEKRANENRTNQGPGVETSFSFSNMIAYLVLDSGLDTNKELNFIARSLMASCLLTSKCVYRVLTNFSPNPAMLNLSKRLKSSSPNVSYTYG